MHTLKDLIILAVVATVATSAGAGIVVTEAFGQPGTSTALSLLNLSGQQGVAHTQVHAIHTVTGVATYDATTLAGADIAYLQRDQFSADEVSALANFAMQGGRLILAGDHGVHTQQYVALAAQFGVAYATGSPNFGVSSPQLGTVVSFDNPITSGAAGVVYSFSALSPNWGLAITSLAVQSVATYGNDGNALAYLRVGLGDVVFLTDANTFDDVRLQDLDNQKLWTNLFVPSNIPEPSTLALFGVGICALVIKRRRQRKSNLLISFP